MKPHVRTTNVPPAYGPLVEECAKHGISKTVAYELANAKLIETFKIGARRYVVLESLHTLPRRMLLGEKAAA